MNKLRTFLALTLLCCMAVNAGGALAESYLPSGMDDEAFAKAVAQGRVALRPARISLSVSREEYVREARRYNAALAAFGNQPGMIPLDGIQDSGAETLELSDAFYEAQSYLSLSPDGTRMLAVSGGIPWMIDLAAGSVRFLAPDGEMDPLYYDKFYQRIFGQIEDQGVVWSQDGRYIALCFPRQVLQMMRLGINALLVDVERGTVAQLVRDLPPDLKIFSASNPYKGGAPLRAVFDGNEPVIYYEAYAAEILGHRHSAIRSRNLKTGETKTLAFYDAQLTTSDPRLYLSKQGFIFTVADVKNDGARGIAIMGTGAAPDAMILRDPKDPLELFMINRLIALEGNKGILQTIWPVSGTGTDVLQMLTLDSLSGEAFKHCLLIRPDSTPAQRLMQADLADVVDAHTLGFRQNALDGLERPVNAALSPEGRYLLLTVHAGKGVTRLYLYDAVSGVLGKVDLSESGAGEQSFLGMRETPKSNMHRGLIWLGNNRLLVGIHGKYRVFELAVTPGQ